MWTLGLHYDDYVGTISQNDGGTGKRDILK